MVRGPINRRGGRSREGQMADDRGMKKITLSVGANLLELGVFFGAAALLAVGVLSLR